MPGTNPYIVKIKQSLMPAYRKYNHMKAGLIHFFMFGRNREINDMLRDYNKCRAYGPRKHFCYVPMNNVLFSKEGKVQACSYNQKIILGYYPKKSINQILTGPVRRKLIKKHLANELTGGCEYCLNFLKTRKFNGIKPMTFDKYSSGYRLDRPRVLEFDLSSRCNLNCIMCNETNRDKIPPEIYDDNFIEQLTPYLKHIKEAKFYGGEPFMIKQYYDIWEKIVQENPQTKIFVITSGTILNENIKSLLERGIFEIGVSMDGMHKEVFEKVRVGANFEQVMKNVEWFSDYCKRKKTDLSVSLSVQRANWKEIPDFINYCNKLDCSVFFSYVYRPEDLSLWTLPPEEIDGIITFFNQFNFPSESEKEKYNLKCYHDIITHLKYWKHENESKANIKDIKDHAAFFVSRLEAYYKKKNSKNPGVEAVKTKDKIVNELSKLGYGDKLQFVFKELNTMRIEDILIGMKTMKKEDLETQLKAWLR